jgi:hypothetical protein
MAEKGVSNFIIVHKYFANMIEFVFNLIISHNLDVLN